MKLHIGGVSLFLALSGIPLGIANALDTGVQNQVFHNKKILAKE